MYVNVVNASLFRCNRFIVPRHFSTILVTGEKCERELSTVERDIINNKESNFSKLGNYNKRTVNESLLYKFFQTANKSNDSDYSAVVYAINQFYNFGVKIDNCEFASRWLSLAVEMEKMDEAVEIAKLWGTWLSCPPRIELLELLIKLIKDPSIRYSILKAMREDWRVPLSPTAYYSVIANEPNAMNAFVVWRDATEMGIVLNNNLIIKKLIIKLKENNLINEMNEIIDKTESESIGGFCELEIPLE